MATIAQVMDALADQLYNQLQPETDIDLHIEPRAFAVAETPAIDMFIMNATGLEANLQGFDDLTNVIPITLRVRVSTADLYTGEDLLLALMDDEDPLSIVNAIDTDRTISGHAQDTMWPDGFPWTGYQDFQMPNADGILLGSTLPLVVTKAKS